MNEQNKRTLALTGVLMALALLFILALLWGVGSVSPVRANPGTRYVDVTNGNDANIPCEDPNNPCASIGTALAHVQAGEEILIAGGHYVGAYNIATSATLRGGYQPGDWTVRDIQAYPTVVDAVGADAPVFHVTPFLDVTFEGLTIKGANHSAEGGGIFINSATVLISDTIVRDNTANSWGGGIYGEAESGPVAITLEKSSVINNQAGQAGGGLFATGTLTLSESVLEGNTAGQDGGGGLRHEGRVLIEKSRIVDNTAGGSGGGIMAQDLTVRDSTISGNEANGTGTIYGGGISLSMGQTGRLTVTNSLVTNNQAIGTVESIGGGIDAEFATALIAQTIISGNSATAHGGVSLYHTVLSMTNSLVHNNTDVGVGGQPVTGTIKHLTAADNESNGLRVGGDIEIHSSVLWGNGATDYVCWEGCTLAYSDIGSGDPAGKYNISEDPLFVDPTNHDYHLQGGSPAVNRGDPYSSVLHDLDGQPRDGRPDMGAYELERLDHDVAVRNAFPQGRKQVGFRALVGPQVENAGLQAQHSVPVTCKIEHEGELVFQETRTTPGDLPIPPMLWTIPFLGTFEFAEEGNYLITCQSALAGDQRPENDIISDTLTAVPKTEDAWTMDNWDDDGEEPSDIDDWYQSPDLWVRHTDDGGLWHQDPIAGQTNYVYVRLRNRGGAPAAGSVDLSWIEPSLAARCGDWAPIATLPFEKLYPDREMILKTAWVPSRSGHTCLQSVITTTLDPYDTDLECDPLWVPYDNNAGWHNVNIVENSARRAQGPQDVLEAEARLVNVYNLPKDVDLIVERLTFPLAGDIVVQLPAELFDRWQAHGAAWGEGIEVLPATKEIRVSGAVSGTVGAIPLETAEEATVNLRFEADAGLEFETAIRERIGGQTVGGVAYQWVIPDTTPPDVVGVSPSNGATDVPLNAPLVLTFTEEIGPLSLDLDLTPDPGGWDVAWNEAGTVFTLTHASLAAETLHTASITANDAWGNPLATPFQWSFTTGELWRTYLPLILRGD